MNLSSSWKGFYSNCDNECYNLTDTHKGGFFSCTFSALNSIVQAYNYCKILPRNINLDACLSMSCDSSGNLYDAFFSIKDAININSCLGAFSDPNKNMYKIPIIFASRPFREQNYNAISPLWNKYFNLNENMQSLCGQLINKYNINPSETLGVYYRGSDKIKEEQLPTYQEYINKAKETLAKGSFKRVIIQTDEEKFKDLFLSSIKNSFHIDELGFSETGDGVHRELRQKGRGRTKNSEYMLAVVYIFSQLNSLIVNTSHVSYAMCLYRNSVKNVLQYRRGAWIA